ncbi:hypothetical protein IJ076_03080 [Candidatus Saccharibacteria bacterium]|nr:hypothetical protein [Candidatus Saccharibacteria bacterium]
MATVKAKIYNVMDGQTAKKAFANVSIGGLMHINSYTVTNTIGDVDHMYAFPPSFKGKNDKYKPYVEFPDFKENPLAKAIYKACVSAYKHYENTGRLHEYGGEFEVDLNKCQLPEKTAERMEINISDIPF